MPPTFSKPSKPFCTLCRSQRDPEWDRDNQVQGCAGCQPWSYNGCSIIYCYTEYYLCSCDNNCGAMKPREVYGLVSPEEMAANPTKLAKIRAEMLEYHNTVDADTEKKKASMPELLSKLNDARNDLLVSFDMLFDKSIVERMYYLKEVVRTTTDKAIAKAAIGEMHKLWKDSSANTNILFFKYEKFAYAINDVRKNNISMNGTIISADVEAECVRNDVKCEEVYGIVADADSTMTAVHRLHGAATTIYVERRWELRRWRVWNAVSGLFARAA